MPTTRRPSFRRTLRPRLVFLIVINVLSVIGFFAWREHYVTKESLLNMMDERLMAVFSPEREITVAEAFESQNFTGKAAYVSTICFQEDIIPVRVLVHSIYRTGTSADILIMIMAKISDKDRAELVDLGAKLVDTSMIELTIDDSQESKDEKSYESAEQEKEISKAEGNLKPEVDPKRKRMCRSNSIQAWRLIEYERVLYMSPEMMVLKNVDDIFQEPPFTATLELGGVVDESIMLLESSMTIYKELKKIMINTWHVPHDIGFLNYFFKGIHPLNPVYNVKAKYAETDYSRYVFGNARIYNYEGTMKPWSFWYQEPKNWRSSFNEEMLYRWQEMSHEVSAKLKLDSHELLEWRKERGSKDVCERYLANKVSMPDRIMDKYSVMLATYSLKRQETLPFVVNQFLMSPRVDKIFIVWHNKNMKVSKNIRQLLADNKDTVIFLNQTVDSLNNRFNPVPEMRTGAVLIADDDVWTSMDDIHLAFEAWQRQPDSLVGFAPRVECFDPKANTYKYCWAYKMNPQRYSIILTKLMFMDEHFLFLWRCGLPDHILKYVDDLVNCEDIAMNFLMTGVTGQPPFHIVTDEVYDFGLDGGISSNPSHWKVRGECIQRITELFGRNTLKSARGSLARYRETDFLSTTWEEFLHMIREKESNAQGFSEAAQGVFEESALANDWDTPVFAGMNGGQ
ncbi:glycosyl transferase family 64 domain-containing protein [Myxozyma melibiosi]|uniref:Glycosyl transferase family 64 domain-containing protein n=1 Tax=Myxozyma melibiosi TaxID=54550 RepID=A0ABR1FAD4_9ASCO